MYKEKSMIKIILIYISFILLLNADEIELEKVKLQLEWQHQFEFAGFYAAKEKGFYKDVGFDVEFIEYNSSIDITHEVLNANADYGITYSSIIAEYLSGKPVYLMANFFKQSPLVIVAQKDITIPAELKGKTIMGVSNSIDNIVLLSMLNKYGISHTDVKNVPASFSIDEFINKKVDAMSVFTTNEIFELNEKKIKYNVFNPAIYGAKYYDVNLFTTQKRSKENPLKVKNFKEASVKGWEYALSHQEEIIELILKKYNTQNKSKKSLQFEAKQIEQLMLPNIYKIGSIDKFRLQSMADSFIQSGLIENIKNKNLDSFFSIDTKGINKNDIEKIELTQEESLYLQNKKEIKICVDPSWMPFEKIDDDKYMGIVADYMNLFSKKIDIPFSLIKTTTWVEALERAKNRECDILPLAEKTPNRSKYFNFSTPYISVPVVIATKVGIPFIDDFEQIKDKKLGVVKGYSLFERLTALYPNINFIEVYSLEDGLKQVESNKIFGLIDSSITINHAIQKNYIGTLSITGKFKFKMNLSVATRSDEKILQNIFEKLVLSVDKATKQKILNNWVNILFQKSVDYTIVWKIALLSLLIILVGLYWNRRLSILNKQLELEKQKAQALTLKAQESTKFKSEFLANMSHEIRTPMNGIIGMSHLVLNTELSEKQKNYILKIDNSAKSLLGIINDILDFSKIEAGKLKIEKQEFDLHEIVDSVISLIEFQAEEKNLKLNVKYDESVERTLLGDKLRITQILTNIMQNGVKFTSNGEVSLLISKLDKECYRFTVKDTGIGLNPQQINKLFESFSQADGSITRKYGGTGLGLSISKQLVELMDGKIWVESQEGVGSSFIFEIQLKAVKSQNREKKVSIDKNEFEKQLKTINDSNILLVEDNKVNQEIMTYLLENSGINITIANNGKEALELYFQNNIKYELILMDLQMPIMDGFEATKCIREKDKEIPIIALTANAMREDIEKTKQAGMVEHLIKPIEVEKLYEVLLKYLSKNILITEPQVFNKA